jgi:hypothetical protein
MKYIKRSYWTRTRDLLNPIQAWTINPEQVSKNVTLIEAKE